MRRGRQDPGEERRRERVEINLADENEDALRPTQGRGRGCALPFGIWLLALAAVLAAHVALGVL